MIAKDLRVSIRPVQRWRRTWSEGGPRTLRSEGPAAHGWEDRQWTLTRVKTVIGRRFHLTCMVQGVRKRLVQTGSGPPRDGRRSFSWRDYRDLLTAQPVVGSPIAPLRDNVNVHNR
ncbi:hypothetical protein [Streptomyces sp. NPDC092307]|uniref:hypothetical protein n=1 Tax=Streptomyces sp. NPDC092307 TaxID=3366013 RepID=UPI0037F1872A